MSSFDTTRASSQSRPDTTTFDMGLRRHMLKVYNYMASGVLLTGIVAMLSNASGLTGYLYGKDGNTILGLIAIFAPLAYIFFLNSSIRHGSITRAQTVFWSFAAVMGISMSTVFMQYTGTSIATTFFATSAAFAGLSLFGYTTGRNLSGMGTFLVMALWGLIAAMVVNMFVGSPAMSYGISAIGILIFSGLTAYDTQKIKNQYRATASADTNERMAIWGAVELYLDFVNLMLHLLRFMGVKKD